MWKQPLRWFLTGMAMGMADIVPGVSGGTIAYISGLYDRLMRALSRADVEALRLLFKGRIKALWQHVDGNFLVLLFVGILCSIFLFASLISHSLENYPPVVWGFFSGLILISTLVLCLKNPVNSLVRVMVFVLGGALAVGVGLLKPTDLQNPGYLVFYLGGALAITAMILPGISGSLILTLIGLYLPILTAVSERQLDVIAMVGLGCITGLIVFPRLLNYLLTRYHEITVAGLTGVVFGSLFTLWPWQVEGTRVLPGNYQALTQQPSYDIWVIIFGVLGMILVWGVHWISEMEHTKSRIS